MISLHINVDFCPDSQLDLALLYLKDTNQRSVNIAGGAQLDRAMQYAQRVRIELPKIRIHFRILEDTGIIMKLSPDQWYNKYIAPRPHWWKDYKIIVVIDNETSGDDAIIREYVSRSSTIADMIHAVGINGDFCRFATGNIQDGSQPRQSNQYLLLKPLFSHLNDGDWISPNEYSNRPGKSSAGHLERWKLIRNVASGFTLNYSIGEAGVLGDYQSRNGYQNFMSDEQMAAQLLGEEIWYEGGNIDRHVFLVGGDDTYSSCRVREGALNFWRGYYAKNAPIPPVVIIPPPPPITPPPPPPPESVSIPLVDLKAIRYAMEMNVKAISQSNVQLTTARDSLNSAMAAIDKVLKPK